ncbi:hypothetical protein IW147_006266 [Coemansia sp. RSA 720]|nr:hypothetical protein IW147_006266 [Coemansia sp. RSA 720]
MWPGSQTGDTNADNDTNNGLSQETPGLDLHWGRDAVDMDLLNELLGTISNHPSAHDTSDELDGTQEITTEAVLQGLRSLDEFEQQAAQTDNSGHNLGFGSFNEAELSAALEQIYWGSLSVPSVDPAEISVPATDFGSPVESPSVSYAPTPVSTPVVCEPSYTNDDDGNSMELEELSLFSLFLSDMSAFEGFLQNLSLNQLRQCAATVNSVLVQREKHAPVEAECAEAQSTVGERVQTGESSKRAEVRGSEPLADSTMSLLREWLPPSTADCVITALQAANLPLPAAKPTTTVQPTSSGGPVVPATRDTTIRDTSNTHAGDSGASEPLVETDSEGTPWLVFVYAQKGKPRRHRIRIDIDRAPQTAIPQSFQQNNCVYPRANCTRAVYAGNRWSYETECNKLGWKLAFLNQGLLAARRGLLQTAVNSYRSAVAGRKSRRVTRMEKAEKSQKRGTREADDEEECGKRARRDVLLTPPLTAVGESEVMSDAVMSDVAVGDAVTSDSSAASGSAVAGSSAAPSSSANTAPVSAMSGTNSPQTAKCLLITAFVNNKFTRIRISIDLASASSADSRFKHEHAVFPRAINTPRSRYGELGGRWEYEVTCNELAWRLAWLNKARLRGRKPLIQKCLDAYRERFAEPPWPLLGCFEVMGARVDPRFFEYWRPRPGRRRLDSMSCAHDSEVEGGVSGSARSEQIKEAELESQTGEGSSAARVRGIQPRATHVSPNAVRPHAGPQVRPQVTGTQTTGPQVRPQAMGPQAGPRPAPSRGSGPAASQVRPKLPVARPAGPTLPRPANPSPRQRPTMRPSGASGAKAMRPAVVGPGTQQPHRPSGPVRPSVRPAVARPSPAKHAVVRPPMLHSPPIKSPTARPTQSPQPKPLVRPPRPNPASSSSAPSTVSEEPPVDSARQGKSAKAQVAANMLTDVLRRLTKDTSVSGTIGHHTNESPLDAQVAELEKMIIDLQR